ncbi:MAG: zinc ribbon domain-containing protein [Candidatus Methanomethylophilaceae archaeon]|jgi:hypothetical protein|nr:zinc ribbon domain-containing protein [Candidatus Methanomethylophilaceae archaeon]
MVQERENYCQLIGLNPLKESTYKRDQIEKKIDSKIAKWRKESRDKANDPENRFLSDLRISMEEDIRRVLLDPEMRKAEFKAASELLKAKSTRVRKDALVLHDGTPVAIPGAVEKYAKTLRWDGVGKEDLMFLSGVKEYRGPGIGDRIVNAYKGLLTTKSVTLQDMLNGLIGNPDLDIDVPKVAAGCSAGQMRSAFEACEKRVAAVRVGVLSGQDTYIQAMRAVKLVLSPDSELNSFMRYCECQKALLPAYVRMDEDYSQPFTRKYIDGILMGALRSGADRDLAVVLLEDYCVRKKYIANFTDRESILIQCPECGAFIEDGDGVRCCGICGHSLRAVCPSCGSEQSSGNRVCVSCGFNFAENMRMARESERRFRVGMKSGDLSAAKAELDRIRACYSTYPGMAGLEAAYSESRARAEAASVRISEAVRQKRFYDAKMHCAEAEKEQPLLFANDFGLSKRRDDALARVAEADGLCSQAGSAVDPNRRMELFAAAADRCPDHPVARAGLRDYPPESPSDASATVRDSLIMLRWAVPAERRGMTFCVYRGRGSLPAVDEDTVPLESVPGGTFIDRTADPGVEYYYSIHSRRWGVLSSEAASCGPAMLLLDVTDVSIEAIEGGLRIVYEKPKGCSRVRIWRKEGSRAAGIGEETEIAHGGETVIDDVGLRGDVKYFYLFVAEYDVKKRTERSPGTVFSGTTVRIPDPVRNMEIRWNRKDGTYTARWENRDEVVLYSSPKKVKMYGKMVRLSDLDSWMTRIHSQTLSENSATFSLPDGAVQYIYPVIPVGKMAVRGKEMMVANLRPFRDVETAISGDHCVVTMNWPIGAESAVLAVVNEGSPKGFDDPSAERIRVSRETYNEERQVRIPMKNAKKRTVAIYAMYDVEGDRVPSRGLVLDIYSGKSSKVRYRMTSEGSGKSETRIRVEVTADPSVKSLPAMSAVAVQEGVPLKRWDGESFWTSGGPLELAEGAASFTMTYRGYLDLSRVRLFFLADEDYNLYKLVHPLPQEGRR